MFESTAAEQKQEKLPEGRACVKELSIRNEPKPWRLRLHDVGVQKARSLLSHSREVLGGHINEA